MRPEKRSLTHCSTKRFGAIKRRPSPANSSRSGRIQVLNCCSVNSRWKESRQLCQNAGVDIIRGGQAEKIAGAGKGPVSANFTSFRRQLSTEAKATNHLDKNHRNKL